ncbi:MAG: hypothetical protein ACOC2D_14385, partial [Spirochaetota bacterium]
MRGIDLIPRPRSCRPVDAVNVHFSIRGFSKIAMPRAIVVAAVLVLAIGCRSDPVVEAPSY